MQTWHRGLAAAALIGSIISLTTTSQADERVVNGYTYIAPSMYLTPPIVYYDPAFAVPAPYVVRPVNAPLPAPVVVSSGPAYVVPTTPVYTPTALGGYGVPSTVLERGYYSRNGLEYRRKQYVPGRAAPVYTYRIDSKPNGVRIRERYR